MKRWTSPFLSLVILVLLSANAQAAGGEGIYLGLHLNYQSSKNESNGNSGPESKTTTADFLLGSRQASELYFGGIYTTVGDDLTVTGSTTNQKATALGLSLGYMPENFLLIAHYFFSGSYQGGSSWDKGSGLGVDIGYLFNLTSNFHLGGGLAYRSIEYKGADTGNSGQTLRLTSTSPRLIFSFFF